MPRDPDGKAERAVRDRDVWTTLCPVATGTLINQVERMADG